MGTVGRVPPVNLYATVAAPPAPPVPPIGHRDRSDPQLAEHLDGLCGWILSHAGDGPPTPAQAHAAEHTWRVHNHYSFDVAAGGEDRLAAFARASNAVVFMPDSTLRDPEGNVIVGPGAAGADVPYLPRALQRREETRTRLAGNGFVTPEFLPPSPCEAEIVLRSGEEVLARAAGLMLVAVVAETRASGDPLEVSAVRSRLEPVLLTERDEAFLAASNVPREALPEFTWKYESLNLLQWALGAGDLAPPTAICDVPSVAGRMFERKLPNAIARSPSEIADTIDEHYRLHWLAVDHQQRGVQPPVQAGVVYERRVALSWLIGLGSMGWDEIPTPT